MRTLAAMPLHFRLTLLSLLALTVIFAAGRAHAAAPELQPESDIEQVLQRMNLARQAAGVGPLSLADDVRAVAAARALDMAARGYLSHSSPEGVGVGDFLDQAGVSHRNFAENIGLSPSPVAGAIAEIHGAWMLSDIHRSIILNPSFSRAGIAIARADSGDLYFAVIFLD